MARKDVFGVEVEVGDIVFSAPRHKWSGKPSVGQVTGVFDSGRVTIKLPQKNVIYAHERGAPKIPTPSKRPKRNADGGYVTEPDPRGIKDWRGNVWQVTVYEDYIDMRKDYTVVDHEWVWVKRQAADITLIILKKGDSKVKDLSEVFDEGELIRNLNLDYSAAAPQLG